MSSFKLADLDSNPPSSMGIKEFREELESMGIGTKSFIEKSEFVKALIDARSEGKKAPGSGGDEEEGPVSSSVLMVPMTLMVHYDAIVCVAVTMRDMLTSDAYLSMQSLKA